MRYILITIMFLFTVFTGYTESLPEGGGKVMAEVKKDLGLTEIEILKLENANLRVKDFRNQFDNLKRNLTTVLQKIRIERQATIKEIEERLGIESGSYKIIGDNAVMNKEETNGNIASDK